MQLDVLDFKEEADQVVTRWRFSSILDLPWRPRLAAAGGTTHVFDKVGVSDSQLMGRLLINRSTLQQ